MTLPTWSHCIPTLNRIDILEQAVRQSLLQTCPPKEIIVVDASDVVEPQRARIEALVASHPGTKPALRYLSSPVKSLTVQRNLAIGQATGEILFLFDDDTLMFPDCAETILRIYASDAGHEIAAGMAMNTEELPGSVHVADDDRKVTGASSLRSNLRYRPGLRWLWDHVFMMDARSQFIAYDDPRHFDRGGEASVGPLKILRLPLLSGYAMTVRAEVAREEPFDDVLLSYSPAEDLDATYRFSRHGMNVLFQDARVHHFEAAAGRIRRRQAITLGLMNLASFIARKSARPGRDIPAYYLRYLRRILAEFLKDGLSRRFSFPQLLGVLSAFGPTLAIFRHGRAGFDDWYRGLQMRVLGWPPTLHPASGPTSPFSPQNHKG
ncbi:MAG: glycosyltransferase [Tabrizicola sp.]